MSRVKPLSLSTLLEQHVLLPSQPRVVALLSSELRKPEPGMRSLVQLFSTDPVLTARLLAAANGPAHLLGQRVHSIPEALVLLAPPAWRRATAGITIALALVFSVNRLAFGGHFLSDVTLSWCITLIVMALCQEVVCRLDEDRLCAGLGRAGASLRRRFGGR